MRVSRSDDYLGKTAKEDARGPVVAGLSTGAASLPAVELVAVNERLDRLRCES